MLALWPTWPLQPRMTWAEFSQSSHMPAHVWLEHTMTLIATLFTSANDPETVPTDFIYLALKRCKCPIARPDREHYVYHKMELGGAACSGRQMLQTHCWACFQEQHSSQESLSKLWHVLQGTNYMMKCFMDAKCKIVNAVQQLNLKGC